MLGTSSLEEALDYLAANFNLKTKSLAKSFLSISKSIKKAPQTVSPELVAKEKLCKLIDLSNSALKYKKKNCFSYKKLASFYDNFYYLRREFVNNIVDRKTFDSQCDALFTELEHFIFMLSECQEKDYAIDVENLLVQ